MEVGYGEVRLCDELVQDHGLGRLILVHRIKHAEHVSTKPPVGHRLPIGIQLGAEDAREPCPCMGKVCIGPTMENGDLFVELH
eukprot:CAMPEP_0115051514 /NCGR_PEP_ID=MMETSP0227-20121206/2388_1 /TAXON_ID=89957 /ORGANISM="Polarella glacialis, Strain CCMP 1383" /LENGTH=82 /DNA_ID=CAMNT_0002435501 /DNA_START=298 /DNA_END=546 /DNA_ORIENTATION=-